MTPQDSPLRSSPFSGALYYGSVNFAAHPKKQNKAKQNSSAMLSNLKTQNMCPLFL